MTKHLFHGDCFVAWGVVLIQQPSFMAVICWGLRFWISLTGVWKELLLVTVPSVSRRRPRVSLFLRRDFGGEAFHLPNSPFPLHVLL